MAGQEATAVLRDRHRLRPEEEDDFNIRNPEGIIQAQLYASKTSDDFADRNRIRFPPLSLRAKRCGLRQSGKSHGGTTEGGSSPCRSVAQCARCTN